MLCNTKTPTTSQSQERAELIERLAKLVLEAAYDNDSFIQPIKHPMCDRLRERLRSLEKVVKK